MASLPALVREHTALGEDELAWITQLAADGQLLADLSCADLVVWARTRDDDFIAVAQNRPSSAPTLFYRDLVGQRVREQWAVEVERAWQEGRTVRSTEPDWFDEIPTQLRVTPVFMRRPAKNVEQQRPRPIALITRHLNLAGGRMHTRQEETFRECADDMFAMIEAGDFPDPLAPTPTRRGMPRASDGLIRLDPEGIVTFASANALSAINKLGFGGELEGESLAELVSMLVEDRATVDEATPLVVTGRAPWVTDIEVRDITVTLRSIPLRERGRRMGAIVLCRDTSDFRMQEQELITKDATIREIHHRVKNNLQTVAALLRIQARRSSSDEARDSLSQAMRRVSSIAVVHDTLAGGFSERVDFDEVLDRVIKLVGEVSSVNPTAARPRIDGSFGHLPSEYATPLALALTELVTNAIEHGLAGNPGEVVIRPLVEADGVRVTVSDTGAGFEDGRIGSGLGTQIIRTLIEGELSGDIEWSSTPGEGTRVEIFVPNRMRDDSLV